MSEWHWWATGIITAAHVVGGVTAFGSSLLAMALLVAVGGTDRLHESVAVLAWCGLLQAGVIATSNARHIRWREALYTVASVGVLLPVGRYTAYVASQGAIKAALGVLLAGAGICLLRAKGAKPLTLPRPVGLGVLALAGCVHGAFASGGTVLVPYMRLRLPERDSFRATLAAIWTGLNILLAALVWLPPAGASRPRASGDVVFIAVACGGALVATVAGQRIARGLNEKTFAVVVACAMLGSGLLYVSSLLWR
ncbi:MAG: sulfite exporter TauE/SafE family protein [Phycisphaerae bacterium]|nr:sulfite exporter TauE/SafE family protein [Phycisphaerae bacterium]